ncbi:MAG: RNA-guided pseudouridylation complex pseudouridine synthase subunit Cbf5 [Candidatus Diapherotrites archaeon]|nr:RNA-guided pseudouridylation complex pseudouridine synthase subunit Cbf5 [Candidatus Diapherotrites archaeon]
MPQLKKPAIVNAKDNDFLQNSGKLQRSIKELLECSVINIDKPPGPSSHEVSSWVKKILDVKKVGHGGTLDPRVTGVLPMGVNKGARVMDVMSGSLKEYVGVMQLHSDDVSLKDINEIAIEFTGRIYQRPPVKSAVRRVLRIRKIYGIEILEKQGRLVLFKVLCEAGTYIRNLCVDIGEALGCGAHMRELRRIKTGPFTEKNCVTMQELMDAKVILDEKGDEKPLRKLLLNVENGILNMPKAWVSDSAVDALCHGADLMAPGIVKITDDFEPKRDVAIVTEKNELVAMGKAKFNSKKMIEAKKGTVIEVKKVIMAVGTYPRLWGKSKKTVKKT